MNEQLTNKTDNLHFTAEETETHPGEGNDSSKVTLELIRRNLTTKTINIY